MSATRTFRDLLGADRPDSVSGETFDDHDPYTGEVVARVPAGGREDARRAIETASEAFASWSKSPPSLRQQIFLRAADILESRGDEVVSLLATGDSGHYAITSTSITTVAQTDAAFTVWGPRAAAPGPQKF